MQITTEGLAVRLATLENLIARLQRKYDALFAVVRHMTTVQRRGRK